MINTISRMLAPLKARLNQLMRVGMVKRVDSSQGYQKLQVILANEDPHLFIRYQDFGLYSVPEENARALVLFPCGSRESGMVICVSKSAQKEKLSKLKPGETALYNAFDACLLLKKDSLEIGLGTSKLTLFQDGKIQILSGGVELIGALQKLISQIQSASTTGTTPSGGPVTFASPFPSGQSLNPFVGAA